MNRLILTLLMCLAASGAFAQIADIKVTYGYNHHDPTGKAVNSKMVLLADRKQSKFFSGFNDDNRGGTNGLQPDGSGCYGKEGCSQPTNKKRANVCSEIHERQCHLGI